jgi:hypothetical protein
VNNTMSGLVNNNMMSAVHRWWVCCCNGSGAIPYIDNGSVVGAERVGGMRETDSSERASVTESELAGNSDARKLAASDKTTL